MMASSLDDKLKHLKDARDILLRESGIAENDEIIVKYNENINAIQNIIDSSKNK